MSKTRTFVVMAILSAFALAWSTLRLPLFFGVDFLFGSVFAFIALLVLGLAGGLLVAMAAGAYTLTLWGHPYALVAVIAEILFVGLAMRRNPHTNLPASVMIYWLVCGLPLIVLSHHFVLGMPMVGAGLAAFKQAVNEVFNALLAVLIVVSLPARWLPGESQTTKMDFHHILTNLLAVFGFLPALVVIVVTSRHTLDNVEMEIQQELSSQSAYMSAEVVEWQKDRLRQLEALAKLGTRAGRDEFRLVMNSNPDWGTLRLVDPQGNISLSLQEDLAARTHVNFADRAWFQKIVASHQPVISNVMIGQTSGQPVIVMAVPVLDGERLTGIVLGTVMADSLIGQFTQGHLSSDMRITLVDQEGHIIGSNLPGLGAMQHFERGQGGIVREQSGAFYRVEPVKHSAAMLAWSGSYYARENSSDLGGWTLVIEQQLLPYANQLQKTYLISFVGTFILALAIFLFGSRMGRILSDPLKQLGLATSRLRNNVASQPELSLPASRVTEISALVEDFQGMAMELRSSYTELQKGRDELEQRVKTRTAELQQQKDAIDIHAIVSITDAAGNIIYVNDHFCLTSGYDREELIGQNHRIVKSGQHSPAFYQEMWDTISQGRVWQNEICNLRKDGSLYWVESTIVPFLDDSGIPYQYLSIRTDITHIKLAELELERQGRFLQTLVDYLPGMVGYWNRDLECGFANSTYLEWFGRTPEQMIGIRAQELLGDELFKKREPNIRAALNGEMQRFEQTLTKTDGSMGFTWTHYIPDIHDGEVQGFYVMISDITEIKLAQFQLEEANTYLAHARDQAERANRAKSEFLSSMSHELRTPMNAILGFSQLLSFDMSLGEQQRENIQEILNAGQHLLDLINEVLDLARVESGNISLTLEAVELCPVVQECIALLSPLATRKNVSMLHKGLAGVVLLADRVRLRQVIINLASNAIKYNQDGGMIHIGLLDMGTGKLRILIRDSGPGIEPEKLDQLFKPFNRLGRENSSVEGTGIGLTITKRLVEMMGGEVGVESQPGSGSTFWIELRTETQKVEEGTGSLSAASGEPVDAAERPHTILYIDDNQSNLNVVVQIIAKRPKTRLLTTQLPARGIELANALKPDMILLDINMPDMNGYQVLEYFKSNQELRDIPVVAITAFAKPSEVMRGLEAGFAEYLTKPIDVGKLLATIDLFLR